MVLFIFQSLNSPINFTIIVLIVILALIDLTFKKDLKSQIVSLGVLGTFIGIFIGLQSFDPSDMKNSINGILEGLKTAFFTSIVGMGTALLLSIFQKIFYRNMDDSQSQDKILLDISNKLNFIEKLGDTGHIDKLTEEVSKLVKTQSETKDITSKVVHILQNLFNLQTTSKEEMKKVLSEIKDGVHHVEASTNRLTTAQLKVRDETIKIAVSIHELKENSNQENLKLISILDTNFSKMNHSLEIAIDKLSEGATKEIIKALEQVIRDFNQELQDSFGDNFVKLNESVINLLEWQNNYKNHIKHIDSHLELSQSSIEKSKESLEVISLRNEEVVGVYDKLKDTIETYDQQTKNLTMHLETYSQLSSSAKNMFSTIEENISGTKEEFTNLTEHIKQETHQQVEYSKETTEQTKEALNSSAKSMAITIEENISATKKAFTNLTKHIKEENNQQVEYSKETTEQIKVHFDKIQKELDTTSIHFKDINREIPEALKVSLEALNIGLTSLTKKFKKDYDETLENYRRGNN